MENDYFIPDIEIWKDIKGYEKYYEISNLGNVRRKSYLLSTNKTYDGYQAITLCANKTQKTKTIHRLVAETFIENIENKPQVNHIDGNKSNNKLENLEWMTSSENVKHALKLGLKDKNWQDGEKNINSKLTEKQVLLIKEKLKNNKISVVYREYADIISYNTIYAIKTGRLWKNI
jgi:hypothetical protein